MMGTAAADLGQKRLGPASKASSSLKNVLSLNNKGGINMLFSRQRKRMNMLSILAYPMAFIKGIVIGRILGRRF